MDCDLGEGWSAFFLLKKSKDASARASRSRSVVLDALIRVVFTCWFAWNSHDSALR